MNTLTILSTWQPTHELEKQRRQGTEPDHTSEAMSIAKQLIEKRREELQWIASTSVGTLAVERSIGIGTAHINNIYASPDEESQQMANAVNVYTRRTRSTWSKVLPMGIEDLLTSTISTSIIKSQIEAKKNVLYVAALQPATYMLEDFSGHLEPMPGLPNRTAAIVIPFNGNTEATILHP